MLRGMNSRRIIGVTMVAAAVLSGVFLMRGERTADAQASAPRGNPPGEWRYWGADAWSTRYSPLDQINA